MILCTMWITTRKQRTGEYQSKHIGQNVWMRMAKYFTEIIKRRQRIGRCRMDWIQIKCEGAWIYLLHYRLSIHKLHNTIHGITCIKSCIQVAAAAEAPLYPLNPNYKYDAESYQIPI